jgi:UDP-2,3-diacylglucosamine pyrophosphatase LpxH
MPPHPASSSRRWDWTAEKKFLLVHGDKFRKTVYKFLRLAGTSDALMASKPMFRGISVKNLSGV